MVGGEGMRTRFLWVHWSQCGGVKTKGGCMGGERDGKEGALVTACLTYCRGGVAGSGEHVP